MSPAQARMWFVSKHQEDHSAYNMVFRYRVRGSLSLNRLRHALATTMHYHEALRTCFFSRPGDGQLMQGVKASSLPNIKQIDITGEKDVSDEMKRLATRQWDLEVGDTFEMVLLSRNQQDHECFFAYHHILMDVVGLGIVIRDIDRAYRMQPLDRNVASYLDYSSSQHELLENGAFDARFAFWQSEFATFPETLALLPVAKVNSRPDNPGIQCHHTYRELKPEHIASLKSTCRRLRVSPFHFHLATLQVLLARQTNTEDLCLGIVDANRSDENHAQTVGYFVNMLPVRAQIHPEAEFADIAGAASQKVLQVLERGAVPFDMLLDKIKAPRSSQTTPLFQAALNYRTGSIWEMPLGEARMEMKDVKDAHNPFDLSLGIAETPHGCMVELYGLASLYDAEGCSSILDSYIRLLETFCRSPFTNIADPPLFDDAKIQNALSLGKGQRNNYDWTTLSHRFAHVAKCRPTDIAVKHKGSSLTYSQLINRVQDVADAMSRQGCVAGSRVAVLCEPSLDSTIAMLATLHIGAVYIPLDVSLPTSRHALMVQNCNPAILLSHSDTKEQERELREEVGLQIRRLLVDSVDECNATFPCSATPNDPGIILFTSGSTGRPKGVVLTQGNFANHVAVKADVLKFSREVVLQQSSLSFDMSLIQIFSAFANGGQLVIAPSEIRRDPVELSALLTEGISVTIATPSEYSSWIRYGSASLKNSTAWRHACMGGEPVTQHLKNEFKRLGLDLQLTNCYGPTEITAAATFHPIDLSETADGDLAQYTVGKAIPNYSVCTVDGRGRLQPPNHTGEICISGQGVALGYLDLPEESNRKFCNLTPGQRWYRTGDQGRLLADGTMLCFGRIDGDTQIKIRGLRVELEEIEAAVIRASEGKLSSAIVSRRGDTLVAHATAWGHAAVTDQDLSSILKRVKLPQYFIPASIIILSSLPVNANGKVDRKAIAALPLPHNTVSTPTEQVQEKMTISQGELRLLWERVLPQTNERISPSSDFFALGGNSMLLMKLQAAIKDTMRVQASTRSMYQSSTLSDMSKSIDALRKEQSAGDAGNEINWDAETAVPGWLLKQIHNAPIRTCKRPSKKSNVEILLTGSTGFLGSHLLERFLESESVAKVHCVAVLPDDQHLLPESEKVALYTGSLLSPNLGLNPDERDYLGESADVIIHAGSSGHCLNTYASLRTPNVESTQFLASLSSFWSIPFMFLSSNRVVLLSGDTAPIPGSVARFHPSTDGTEGHMMSRWASEVFLEKLSHQIEASQQVPFNISIHRPSVVVSDQAPNSDALNAILRYSVSMRRVPRLDRVKGYMDLLPIEKLTSELFQSALTLATGLQNARMSFRHHSGGAKVPADQLRGHLESLYNVEFEELDMRQWLDCASDAGMDPLIVAYMEGILENDAPMVFAYMGEEGVFEET